MLLLRFNSYFDHYQSEIEMAVGHACICCLCYASFFVITTKNPLYPLPALWVVGVCWSLSRLPSKKARGTSWMSHQFSTKNNNEKIYATPWKSKEPIPSYSSTIMKTDMLFQLFKKCFKLETGTLELYLDLNYEYIKITAHIQKIYFCFICRSAGGEFLKR